MLVDSPRIRSLLRQADSVAAAGKRAAAEQLYRQIIEEAPETAQAWYGLAQVVRDQEDREAALERARELKPDYEQLAEQAGETTIGAENALELKAPGSPVSNDSPAKRAERDAEVPPPGELSDASTVREQVPVSAAAAPSDDDSIAEALYCANHPNRRTHLRCNRCGKPICSSCAHPTPVGYRCPECIREQEEVYFSATPIDYVIALAVALPLCVAAGWVASLIGFWSFFLAAFAGTLIGRISFRAAGRTPRPRVPYGLAGCVVVGGVLPFLLFRLNIAGLVFMAIYAILASGATYYQMR
jgi:hypothetical protein